MTQLALPSRGALVKVGARFPDLLPGVKEKHDAALGVVMAIFYVGADTFEPEGFEVLTVPDVALPGGSLPQRVNELISTPAEAWAAKGTDPSQIIPILVNDLETVNQAAAAEGCCSIRVPMKVDGETVFPVSRLSFVEFLSQVQDRVRISKRAFEEPEPDDDDGDDDDDDLAPENVKLPAGMAWHQADDGEWEMVPAPPAGAV